MRVLCLRARADVLDLLRGSSWDSSLKVRYINHMNEAWLCVHRQWTLKGVAIVEKSIGKQRVSCVGSMSVCEWQARRKRKKRTSVVSVGIRDGWRVLRAFCSTESTNVWLISNETRPWTDALAERTYLIDTWTWLLSTVRYAIHASKREQRARYWTTYGYCK